MSIRARPKLFLLGLSVLALVAGMDPADAQRRRLPSRTEPIPDTETQAERAKQKEGEQEKEAETPRLNDLWAAHAGARRAAIPARAARCGGEASCGRRARGPGGEPGAHAAAGRDAGTAGA